MKKLLAIAVITAFMVSCNDSNSTKTESTSDSSNVGNSPATDTSISRMNKDSSGSMSSSQGMASSTMTEGSMTMKDGKMMVMKDGKMVMMDQQVTCTDG